MPHRAIGEVPGQEAEADMEMESPSHGLYWGFQRKGMQDRVSN